MSDAIDVAVVLRIAYELIDLSARALDAGRDVSKEEVDAAFERAGAADAAWANALKPASELPSA